MTTKKREILNDAKFINTKGIAALLMDAQPRLLESIKGSELLIQSLEIYAGSMRILEVPVLLTEQVPAKLGTTIESISQHGSKTFSKNSFSAFGDSQFCKWVEQNEISHILLGGIETSICIYLTALEARRRNMEVTILSDCVSGRRKKDGEYAMNELINAGVHVLGLETILYSILRSSEHAAFKDISTLIRERII